MENSNEVSSNSPVKNRWDNVLRVRGEIVTELDQMAEEFPGDTRAQLHSLSRWFKGPAKFEEAIRRPDVLAVCLPLINSDAIGEKTSSTTGFGRTVRTGFLALAPNVTGARHLVRVMLYPLLILLASLILVVVFSCTIAPQFQEMFEEFGIDLPGATKLVFWVCGLFRQWWWAILPAPLVVALCFWIINRVDRDARPGNLSWLDQRLMSTRNACAAWVWHVSLLLEAGFAQDEAVATASDSSCKPQLQRVGPASAGGSEETESLEPQLFSNPKYHLASCTMQLPPSKGKNILLREVAAYYWDRNRNVGDWWIHWLNGLILWMVGFSIVFAIVAMFMPLIAIVSGLTSGKF